MCECVEHPLDFLVTSDEFHRLVQDRLEDPNERNSDGNTLLHEAAGSLMENSGIVQLLLDSGADVDSTNTQERTPLHFAVCSRKRNTIVTLIEAGASINSEDFLQRTPLHFAITKRLSNYPSPLIDIDCDIRVVKILLWDPEIFLNPQDETGETPLMWAVKEQNLEAIRELLKKGANPNISNFDKQTPLHVALSVRNPSPDVVALLLTNGADIYCVDDMKQTPVDILVRSVWDDETLAFASMCLWWMAFRYLIRDSLKRKLERIPVLSNHLNECCTEVRLMIKIVIYEKITLYDFVLDCFQGTVESYNMEIYIPVVEKLLSGFFRKYFDLILCRISLPDLRSVIRFTDGGWLSLKRLPPEASYFTVFDAIERLHDENYTLKRRLRRSRALLLKKINFYLHKNY